MALALAAWIVTLGMMGGLPPETEGSRGGGVTRAVRPGEVRRSQVRLAFDHVTSRREFRGTVLSIEDGNVVTILTAAHCLSPGDVNTSALLLLGGEVVEGKVLSVVWNPAYHVAQGKVPDLPGPDNAVARFRFEPANMPAAEAFRTIVPAWRVASRAIPSRQGERVNVRLIDGEGRVHTLHAGNFANHRLLEWGTAYIPNPGDSGSGVFAFQYDANGDVRPVLIGVVVGRTSQGGSASLVSLSQPWLARALGH